MQTHQGFLPAIAPFDFDHSLRFVGSFSPTANEQTIGSKGKLCKAISFNQQALVFTVEKSPKAEAGLLYTLQGEKLDETIIAWVEEAISRYLGLQDDLTTLYEVGSNDPAFAPILQKLYGYHQVRFLTPFEVAAWSVLTQRTPIAIARTLKYRLIEHFGAKLNLPDGEIYSGFPEPATLVTSVTSDNGQRLLSLLGNQRKADYLTHVAQAFATDLDFANPAVDLLDRETLKQKLLAIKGIGAWSAEFILIRGYGSMGGIPSGEKELSKAVTRIYKPNSIELATDEEVETFARPYGESKGYWAHYLRVSG